MNPTFPRHINKKPNQKHHEKAGYPSLRPFRVSRPLSYRKHATHLDGRISVMKRTGALFASLAIALTLSSCGSTPASEAETPTPETEVVEEETEAVEEETTAPLSEALFTEDEAIDMLDGVVSGGHVALSEWQSVANAVCAVLDSEDGDLLATASALAHAGSITGTDPETYTLKWDAIDGEGLWTIMFGSTQLACPQWGVAVGDISDSDFLVLNAAVEQISKK